MKKFAVHRLSESARVTLRGDFNALPAQDRSLRFGMALGPMLSPYVDRMNLERDAVLGVHDDRNALVGVAHVAIRTITPSSYCRSSRGIVVGASGVRLTRHRARAHPACQGSSCTVWRRTHRSCAWRSSAWSSWKTVATRMPSQVFRLRRPRGAYAMTHRHGCALLDPRHHH
jgi:hypothetical protein